MGSFLAPEAVPMPGDRQSIREIIESAAQQLQALNAEAGRVTDLTTRLQLRSQIAGLQKALDAALSLHQVPIEITQALRAPDNAVQTVHLDVGGRRARIALHPVGHADAERETQVWADLQAAAAECTSTGQILRPMNSAIGAVDLATLLVLNTAQSRAQLRAAKAALYHGFVLPAPLAIAWKKARKAPKRAVTSVAVAAAVMATAALALSVPFDPNARPDAATEPSRDDTYAPVTPPVISPSDPPDVRTKGRVDSGGGDQDGDTGRRPATRPDADHMHSQPAASTKRPSRRRPTNSPKDSHRSKTSHPADPPPDISPQRRPPTRRDRAVTTTPVPRRTPPPRTSMPTPPARSTSQPPAPTPQPSSPPTQSGQGGCHGLLGVHVPPLLKICV